MDDKHSACMLFYQAKKIELVRNKIALPLKQRPKNDNSKNSKLESMSR